MYDLKIIGKQKVDNLLITAIEGGFGANKRALLVKDIAEIHNQPLYEMNRRIKRNRKRFIEGVDFIDCLNVSEPFRRLALENGWIGGNRTRNVYILSERGYTKLLKILEDDKAWELYDKLVDNYFNMRSEQAGTEQLEQMVEMQQCLIQNMKQQQKHISKRSNLKSEMTMKDVVSFLQAYPNDDSDLLKRISSENKKMHTIVSKLSAENLELQKKVSRLERENAEKTSDLNYLFRFIEMARKMAVGDNVENGVKYQVGCDGVVESVSN